jgi:hypothetical protein
MQADRFRCRHGAASRLAVARHPRMRHCASENDGTDQCMLITPTASSDSNSTFVTS